jgi:hypothetical protein
MNFGLWEAEILPFGTKLHSCRFSGPKEILEKRATTGFARAGQTRWMEETEIIRPLNWKLLLELIRILVVQQ